MIQKNRYAGRDGELYLKHRNSAVSEHVQGLRAALFADIVSDDLVLMDFGCGTGGVIKRLCARHRIGVEIGEEAAGVARSEGIEVISRLEDIPDNCIDVGISFHAIEHVDSPLAILTEIGRVLKPGGHIRLVVPCETPLHRNERSWKPNTDRHLFTWTPLLFGNLADRAGFQNITARVASMPTGSKLVRVCSYIPPAARIMQLILSIRRNRLNVILDASPPSINS